jgi:hypothetical protein
MNWKYGIGLSFTILGAIMITMIYLAIFGAPLYLIGVIFILFSGKKLKTKLFGIFLPILIPALTWGYFNWIYYK